jgi:hypothetical protein
VNIMWHGDYIKKYDCLPRYECKVLEFALKIRKVPGVVTNTLDIILILDIPVGMQIQKYIYYYQSYSLNQHFIYNTQ